MINFRVHDLLKHKFIIAVQNLKIKNKKLSMEIWSF